MNTNQYTKIESTDIRNTKEKNDKSLESTLPPVEEMEKIISDMMLKGCYVSDIYERFGVECPDEQNSHTSCQDRTSDFEKDSLNELQKPFVRRCV